MSLFKDQQFPFEISYDYPGICGSPVPVISFQRLKWVGAAALDLLFGKINPSGHLAETWPVRLQDNPSYLNFPGEDGVVTYAEGIYVGYRYYDKKELAVNFPFGHGLSYTEFQYSDLRVDKEKLTDQELLTVSVNVRNTGSVAGKTVVQLYVGDVESTVRRPVRELKGFEKSESRDSSGS